MNTRREGIHRSALTLALLTLAGCSQEPVAVGPPDAKFADAGEDSRSSDSPDTDPGAAPDVAIVDANADANVDVPLDLNVFDAPVTDVPREDRPDATAPDQPAADAPPARFDAGPCPTCPVVEHATPSCVLGVCASTCDSGFSRCDGLCVAESATRCGPSCRSCEVPAHGAAVCSAGRCGYTCEAGYQACAAGCCRFRIEDVAPSGFGGVRVAIAVGADDRLHLSYGASSGLTTVYASEVGGAWRVERAPRWTSTGGSQRIAVGPDGAPWLLVTNVADGEALLFARRGPEGWVSETLDTLGIADRTGLASDPWGRAHVCYSRRSGGLTYAVRRGDQWFRRDVDAGSIVADACALAVDSRGRVHVGYQLRGAGVRYAVGGVDGFTATTVDPTATAGSLMSLTLDRGDRPRIAYYDQTERRIQFAALGGGAWAVSTARTNVIVTDELSLVVDAAGAPWIGYLDGTLGGVRCSRFDGAWSQSRIDPTDEYTFREVRLAVTPSGELRAALSSGGAIYAGHFGAAGWSFAAVDAGERAGAWSSVALRGGAPVALYLQSRDAAGAAGRVMFAERGAGGWTSAPVATEQAFEASLALDATGTPHGAWRDGDGRGLRYGRRDAGGWSLETVDAEMYSGQSPSVAIAPGGAPAIAYVGSDTAGRTALLFAERSGTTWRRSVIGPATGVELPVLRIAGDGTAHVAFYDGSMRALRVATRSGAAWSTETIEAVGAPETRHDLVLDAGGAPRVCYFRLPTGARSFDLRYAVREGGAWSRASVTVPDETQSGSCALALDASGRPSILQSNLYGAGFVRTRLSTLDGATWTHSLVMESDGAAWPSLVIDPTGRPHLLFGALPSGRLRYATN